MSSSMSFGDKVQEILSRRGAQLAKILSAKGSEAEARMSKAGDTVRKSAEKAAENVKAEQHVRKEGDKKKTHDAAKKGQNPQGKKQPAKEPCKTCGSRPAEIYMASLEVLKNAFGDTLPIIPKSSRTQNNKVLYQIKLKAKLVRADGSPKPNHELVITSNRTNDVIRSAGRTDENGEIVVILETRQSGSVKLTTTTADVNMTILKLEIDAAWYESTFLVTGYHVCDEADFHGRLVDGNGLTKKHKEDFLFGAAGVPMQGTGRATDGRYIRLESMSGGWHRNAAGNRDRVNEQSNVSFSYADGVYGAFGQVIENHSVAVDPRVIPKKSRVFVDGVGERWADDRGSAIKDYHIDNFLGAGRDVFVAWQRSGIDNTQRRIKFLGGSK